ncbi:MAG: SUMF1/EgtB/PvdO family nonheme iron enzyme [Treponema sp.]|nr:SUMF1/EgtB/PvdO family nonheme iron enzyme [Treponema sp.]
MEKNEGFVKTLKSFSFRAAIAALALTGALFSCSNLGDDYSGPSLFPAVQVAGTQTGAKIGMARVSGTIDSGAAVSKSVIPDASVVTSSIAATNGYAVYAWGTKADSTIVPETSPINGVVSADHTTFSIDLPYGTWTVRAVAKNSSGDIILSKSTATPLTLSADNPVANLSFSLEYVSDPSATGALSLEINYDTAVEITKITYSLTKQGSGTAITGEKAGSPTLTSPGSLTIDSSEKAEFGALLPGTYDLVVLFVAADGSTIMRMDQAVQIYSNITTSKIDGNAPYINASGQVAVSDETIKKYQQSVVYVGGTGVNTGIAALDTNNGTQYDPVATLGRAISIVDSSLLTPSDGFKIYVQDNLTLTQNISISGSKKISVIGTNQSGLYKVDGAVTYGLTASASDLNFSYINFDSLKDFSVVDGQIKLNNCKITNGIKALSGSASGGGLFVKGTGAKAVLTNCSISGCQAAYGGAIYVNDEDGGGTDAEVELKDCLIGAVSDSTADDTNHSNNAQSGGGIYVGGRGKLTLSGSNKISCNYASVNGGGIYSSSNLTLDNCDISFNGAEDNGGGVCARGSSITFKFQGGTISANSAGSDGGGVYVGNSAKMIMGGSAVIGDKNADGPATELLSSNKAESGGGIAVADSANVFIGYTDANASSTDDSFDGGIFYNYASGSGGGVYLNGSSAKVYFYKGSVEKNLGLYWGGALAVGDEGAAEINGTSILDNNTAYYGGGISIGESAAGAGTVLVQNSLIARNCALLEGYWEGGAIMAFAYTSLTLKGSVSIPAGDSSGATGPGKNDVWLASAKTITIGSTLDAATTPVATITPATYAPGTAVLSDNTGIGTLVQSELSKIAVTPQSADDEWTIGYDNSTKKGVLATANLYVNYTTGVDDASHGTKTAPYKTVAYAIGKVLAPNCAIYVMTDTTESEALNVTAAMTGLTIKSADTAQKTITGLVTKKINLGTAATISKIAFDTWGSVDVSDNVATVELNDVSIKNSYNGVAGGGLRIGSNAKVKASNLELDNCHAGIGGGGIFVSPGSELNADGLTVTGCYADGAGIGGGICNGGTLFAKDARISGCSAAGGGAGILNDNGASLVLDGDCDISSQIYLMGKSSTMTTASNPIYVKAYFGLASGATKIPVAVEENSGADEQFKDGDALVQGWDTYDIKEAQVNCFATSGTALSLEYDGAATPPCGKLVDKSIAGGVTVNLGGNISFEIATPTASGEKARFNVIDNSSGTPTYVTPTSARIEVKQYGSAIYAAADQEVAAPYLAAGSYELYCKAVVGGVVYDTTVPFGYGALYTPLTLEAEGASTTVTFSNKAAGDVTYRVNGGTEGTIASGDTETIPLAHAGDYVQFYGTNATYATDTTDGNYSNIACNKNCYVYGNIMSLVKSDGFESQKTLTSNYTFCGLFKGNAYIKNKTGADLLLPATTLKDCCYQAMFQNCASLTTVPELPATSVTYHGYYSMFQGCTSLTTSPNLPATSLAMASCCRMFQDCTSLTSAPALPATTMKSNCYESMFQGCTSLASAPELPATTLEYACYAHMFEGCTSLTSAPELPATTLESTCYKQMFSGCTSLTTPPELPAETLTEQCYNSMFDGCTSLASAPALPATTLTSSCYSSMFAGCTSLVEAPELPAKTLASNCYFEMFNGCSSLNKVTCLATNISAIGCTTDWLSGVATSGTFTKAAGMTAWTTGASGIPTGWTVESVGSAVPAGFVVVEGSTVVGGDKFKDANNKTGVFVQGRSVAISTFYMCDHEVTQAEYKAVMGTNPSNWTGDDLPVEQVSWFDAIYYCNKKSIADHLNPCYAVGGKDDPSQWGYTPHAGNSISGTITCDFSKNGYRLPTAAEWEYASRGGKAGCEAADPTDWAGTDSSSELGTYAWYADNSSDNGTKKTHEVKTKTKNSLNLYDMSGNVWEWCWDWYDYDATINDDAYKVGGVVTNPAGASSGSNRVYRGGGWGNDANDCSVALRYGISPGNRDYGIGLRVVRNAP